MKKIYSSFMLSIAAISLVAQPCSKVFFSEYVEGSGFNKAVEIYNPTLNTVDLSTYKIVVIGYTGAGAPTSSVVTLTGTVAAGSTYVVANTQADSVSIRLKSQQLSGNINFNGDDAVFLVSGVDTIDAIGQKGPDPGNYFAVGADSTKDETLIRLASVNTGTIDWAIGVTQWSALPKDTVRLGMHSMTPCAPPADTIAGFATSAATVVETAGSYALTINLNQPIGASKTVDVVLKSMTTGGTATDINGFSSTTATFNAGSTNTSTTITITDDLLAEGAESFTFALRNPSTGLLLGADTLFTLTIPLNDSTIVVPPSAPFYPVGIISTENAAGFVADSLNVRCFTSGVVYGINYRRTGLSFYISDHTGWIQVYSTRRYGYTVTEGDSVKVLGTVKQYNGMTQLTCYAGDTVILLSSANGLQTPKTLTARPAEVDEASLVTVTGLTPVSPWTASGSGFTIKATKGGSNYYIRVDSLTTAYNVPSMTCFDVVGLVSQYDTAAPYDFGYDINVRYAADLVACNGINDEVSDVHAVIFPNPASNQVLVSVSATENKAADIIVRNMEGKLVESKHLTVTSDSTEVSFNTIEWNSGLYFIQIQSGKNSLMKKLSILH